MTDWKSWLGIFGGMTAAVTVIAALAIGLGFVPSASEVKRVNEVIDRVVATDQERSRRVSVVERDTAVQAQQIENIEKTVQRIEATQTAQFRRVLDKLDKMDSIRRGQ